MDADNLATDRGGLTLLFPPIRISPWAAVDRRRLRLLRALAGPPSTAPFHPKPHIRARTRRRHDPAAERRDTNDPQ
jgi:hypothetical protein